MKKIILLIFSVFLPCVIFFSKDLPSAGIVALGLQVSIVGWPIAIIWALKTTLNTTKEKTK